MKNVNYEDVPALRDQLLHEIDTTGVPYEVLKDGKPIARMVPIDKATRTHFAAMRKR
jgi:antitoxin (DNA-binding transcriptional repressor) of toxin-antitoxin stability system